jgi:hypothetical protein
MVEAKRTLVDAVSELRLQLVCPALADKIRALDEKFQYRELDDHLEVVQGLRSWNQQQSLWLKGRDANGNVVNPAEIVTHAPPGNSYHEFGLAVDCCPRSLLAVPGWQPESPLWKVIADLARDLDLVSGSCWMHKDLPHLQLTGKFPMSPDDEVRQIFKDAGMSMVWKEAGIV